jgi:hypothetical protein
VSRPSVALALVSAALLACASGGGTSELGTAAPAPDAAATEQSGDQSRITAAEIAEADLPNAYELVSRLRRPWLRPDRVTGGEVVVYMDEQNLGGPEKLRDIPTVDVAELQYLPNDAAVRRWGAGVQGSVIVVQRRRG